MYVFSNNPVPDCNEYEIFYLLSNFMDYACANISILLYHTGVGLVNLFFYYFSTTCNKHFTLNYESVIRHFPNTFIYLFCISRGRVVQFNNQKD